MKTLVKIFFVLFLGTAVIHCSGASLVGNSLGTLEVGSIHHLQDGSALAAELDAHKELSNDLGYEIHLEEAQLNWHRLKLISGGDDPECVAGNDQIFFLDQVEDILSEDLATTSLATAFIPLISYCQYEVTIAPTPDVSAAKFHEEEDHGGGGEHSGIDVSFHFKGTWTQGLNSGTFEIVSTEEVIVQDAFQAQEDGEVIDHPLHFHEGESETTLVFSTKYDLFFNGIDFMNEDEPTQLIKFIANLKSSVYQYTGGH